MEVLKNSVWLLILTLLTGPSAYASNSLDKKISDSLIYLKDNRGDPLAYEDLGWAYLNRYDLMGDRDDAHRALKLFQTYKKVSHHNPQSWYSTGVALFKLGEIDNAKKHFLETLTRDSENFESMIALGNVFSNKGKFKKAYNYYKQAGQLKPDSAVIYTNLSQLAFKMGQYRRAIQLSETALEKQLGNDAPLLLLAKSYRFLGQDEKAIVLSKQVLKNFPNSFRPYLELSWSNYNMGNFSKARKLALKYNSLTPDSTEGLELLALLYKKTGDKEKIAGIVRLAENQFMKNNKPDHQLGSLAWLNCEFDINPAKGLKYADRYAELNQTDDSHSILGWAYYKNTMYQEAVKQFKKALKLNPNISSHWYRLGLIHKKLNDQKSAQKAFTKALTMGPNTYHDEISEELFLLSSKL